MKCTRCHGWMVNEKFYGQGSFFWEWRCVFCGEILDPVIQENRNDLPKRFLVQNAEFHLQNGEGGKEQ